jgi:ribosomal protein S19E (S16A)
VELVDAIKGEDALARTHVTFFNQMGWIRETDGSRWSITEKGKKNLDL